MNNGFRRLWHWLALGSLTAALWTSACSSKHDDESGRAETGGANAMGGELNRGGTDSARGGAGNGGSAVMAGAANGGTDSNGEAGAGGEIGIGGAPELGDGSGLPNAPSGSWTYLVYLLADNNLEPFALEDLTEMMAVGSGENVTILAEVDRAVGESAAPIGGLPNFTSTKRVRVEAGRLTELEDLGEQNLGSEQTFLNFLEWGINFSPSEHYAVVLWDHGGAWPRYGADDSARGDGLTLPELARGLDAASKSTGLLGPIDLIGFDACLMGTWEVAATLSGRARYLLASEEVEPGHGWDHREIAVLKQGANALALGQALANGYKAQAEVERDDARITLALTDLSQVPALSQAIAGLAQTLANPIDTHAPLVGRARAAIPTFGQIPGGPSTGMVDLLQLVNALSELDTGAATSIAAVKAALDAAVVAKVSGRAFPDVGGLSLFFPQLQAGYDADYVNVSAAASWRSFLSAYYGSASTLTQSPEFINPNKEALVTLTANGLRITGQLRAGTFDNLASTTFDFGLVSQSDTIYLLGEEPASVTANGLVGKEWDQTSLHVMQGTTWDYAYYVLEQLDGGLVSLSVPLAYTDALSEEFVLLQLVFQLDGTLVSSTYYSETSGSWAELVPAPGSTFRTLVPVQIGTAADLDWQPQTEQFDSMLGLDLEFAPLGAGLTVLVGLSATDYSDRGDSVFKIGEL
ncbi:MAG: clostripain-related cysteine peptidase [Myxococcota bacterium]